MIIFIIDYQEIVQYDELETSENKIMQEFANRLGFTTQQILEPNKKTHMAELRHLYCKLRSENHSESFSVIARELGRSHTAVIRGLERINALYNTNDELTVERWNKVKNIPQTSISKDD